MINTPKLSIAERLERLIYLSRDVKFEAVYADGLKIF
jgi:hypothetical protein